ncbi:hypothetical protein D3C72_2062410 [compost metagenome]
MRRAKRALWARGARLMSAVGLQRAGHEEAVPVGAVVGKGAALYKAVLKIQLACGFKERLWSRLQAHLGKAACAGLF